jgi:hypothetical protein
MANPKPSAVPSPALPARPGEVDADFVERFRGQVHGLGGVWLLNTVVAVGLLVFESELGPESPFAWMRAPGAAALVVGYAVLCLAMGVLTFMKKLWALMLGLGLGYIFLIVNVLAWLSQLSGQGSHPLIAVAWSVVVVLQCQRVINWAKQMLAEGIPLTARPADFPRIEGAADPV